MKQFVLLFVILSCTALHAQTLTPRLTGNWQFKEVQDASGKPLEGSVNPVALDLRNDGRFSMHTKLKKIKGTWSEKDSTLYLQIAPDSVKQTQVMRVLKIDADVLEIYAGAEKGNEIRYIYTRRKKK
jgi:hypothetical protein